MKKRFTGLWQQPNFLKYWGAVVTSQFGSGISWLAMPIIGAVLLEATAVEMGILSAAGTLPYLLFGLLAGAWVDRLRKRPILMAADIGRALLLITIPVTAVISTITLPHLIIVTFLSGTLSLFADVSASAYLPVLISRKNMVEGYSKLSATESLIEVSGPGIAASLVELFSAPIAIFIDALSFVVSALLVGSIRQAEPEPDDKKKQISLRQDIRQGLHFVKDNDYLRPMLLNNVTMQLFGGMVDGILIIYLTRVLGLPATFIGVMFAAGALMGLAAAALGRRSAKRFGLGRLVLLGTLLIGVGSLARPLSFGTPLLAGIILLIGQAIQGFGNTIYNIGYDSLLPQITPDHLLGRVNATTLFFAYGALPIGALIGGVIGDGIGLRAALAVSSIGLFWAFLWVFFSVLRSTPSLDSGKSSPATEP